jgi:hypothetical protein
MEGKMANRTESERILTRLLECQSRLEKRLGTVKFFKADPVSVMLNQKTHESFCAVDQRGGDAEPVW